MVSKAVLTALRLLLGLLLGAATAVGLIALASHAVGPAFYYYLAPASFVGGIAMLAGRLLHSDDPGEAVKGLLEIGIGFGLGFGFAILVLGIPLLSVYY